MNARPHKLARSLPLALLLLLISNTPVLATWTLGAAANSSGQSVATSAPQAPIGVTAACTTTLGATVKVTWAAVTHASTYDIWRSTTSATTGFTTTATGVSTTSWTSGNLATGAYWFEVSARIGNNWVGSNSTASTQRTIALAICA